MNVKITIFHNFRQLQSNYSLLLRGGKVAAHVTVNNVTKAEQISTTVNYSHRNMSFERPETVNETYQEQFGTETILWITIQSLFLNNLSEPVSDSFTVQSLPVTIITTALH